MFDNFSGLFSQEWLESAKMYCGESLTDDMIQQSVHEASDFFHIDDPMIVAEYDTTGVLLNGSGTFNDDILVFSREQMNDMGITGKETFDLVMTHEATHRMLQGINSDMNAHQEELCCDFMSGVRAGLNGMDFSGMQESLAISPESDSHPAGISRVYSIKEGAEFAEVYSATHGQPPTFSECLEHFKENVMTEATNTKQVTLREYNSAETTGSIGFADNTFHGYGDDSAESAGSIGFAEVGEALHAADSESTGSIGFADDTFHEYGDDSAESAGGIGFADTNTDEDNSSIKCYTQDEINRRAAKAEKDRAYYESEARHHTSMAKHALTKSNEQYHLKEAKINLEQANKCKQEYLKWKWTKPTEK